MQPVELVQTCHVGVGGLEGPKRAASKDVKTVRIEDWEGDRG